MGQDTVSNHNRNVAGNATLHTARTDGATDVCYAPSLDGNPRKPFPNWIDTETNLADNNSTRTLVLDELVWLDGGHVGPPSEGVHPPYVIGDKTDLPYRKQAWNTSCSDDLIIEGRGAVRKDDTTMQNHANTDGFVDDAGLDVEALNEEELLKKKCGVHTLTGECDGQSLGWRGSDQSGDPYFIEIVGGQTIEYDVTHEDLTQPGEDPECLEPGKHPLWVVDGPADPFVGYGSAGSVSGVVGPLVGSKEYQRQEGGTSFVFADPSNAFRFDSAGPGQVLRGAGEAAVGAISKASMVLKATTLVRMIYLDCNGRRMQLSVAACGNVANSEVTVYPSNAVEFIYKLASDPFGLNPETERALLGLGGELSGNVLGALRRFEKWLHKFEFVKTYAKKFIPTTDDVAIKVLPDVRVRGQASFRRCTRTGDDNHFGFYISPAHVGLSLFGGVGGTFLTIDIQAKLPILTVASWAGRIIRKLIEWWTDEGQPEKNAIGLDLRLRFFATAEGEVGVTRNQNYDVNPAGRVVGTLRASAGVAASGWLASVSLNLNLLGKAELEPKAPDDPKALLGLSFHGQAETAVTVELDTWFSSPKRETFMIPFLSMQLATTSMDWTIG